MSIINALKESLQNEIDNQLDEHYRNINKDDYIKELKRQSDIYFKLHGFEEGDLVQQKKDLYKRYKLPYIDTPAVFIEYSDNPERPTDTARLGVVDPDGDFLVLNLNPHYLEPYEPK